MRRAVPVHHVGVSVAAALVLLTACGGSGKNNTASSSSTTSSSASATTAAAAGSEFCTQAAAIESSLGSAVTNSSDPATVKQALQTAVDKIKALQPPSEIAADWSTLASGVEQLANAFANVNMSDQAAVASFEATASSLEKQLSTPSANVEKYLATTCGLTIPSQSATPTS